LGLTRKSFSIDLVSVTDQMAWGLLQPARLDQLPSSPIRGRMLRDIEMHQSAPVVAQHDEHEQDPKGRRGHREEIQRDQILGVILHKRRHGSSAHPRAGWRGSSAESAPGLPSPLRDDPVGVDSSTPSSAGTPAGATSPRSQAAAPAENSANSSTGVASATSSGGLI